MSIDTEAPKQKLKKTRSSRARRSTKARPKLRHESTSDATAYTSSPPPDYATTCGMNWEAVRQQKRWLVYAPLRVGGKRVGKVPVWPGTHRALDDFNNPEHWTTYPAHSKRGIVLNGDGLVVLDLDGSRDPKTGKPTDWAAEVMKFAASYTEVSPSGTGFKIFLRVPLSMLGQAKQLLSVKMDGPALDGGEFGVREAKLELFTQNQFCVVTDEHVPGTPMAIEFRPTEFARTITWMRARLPKPKNQGEMRPDDIRDALDYVNVSDYHTWLHAGMALKHAAREKKLTDAAAFSMWDEWSKTDPHKYDADACRKKWSTFGGDGITLGTLFWHAEQGGWKRARPKKKKDHPGDNPSFTFKVINGASIKPARIKWLWRGRIPRGTLTLLVGLPELGKSHIYIDIAARITTARNMPLDDMGPSSGPQRVCIFCTEDRIDNTLVPRLTAAGADMSRIDFIQYLENDEEEWRGLDLSQDIKRLDAYLKDTPDVGLIVFDPLTEYLGGKVNGDKNTDIRATLGPLMRMLGERDVAALGVSHLPKAKNGAVQTAALGSIAFSAAARSSLLVAEELEAVTDEEGRPTGKKEPTGRRLLCVNKANLASPSDRQTLAFNIEAKILPLPEPDFEIETSCVRWDGIVALTPRQIWDDTDQGQPPPKKLETAMTFIKARMLDEAASTASQKVYRDRLATEIEAEAERAEISAATLRRAKQELKIESRQKERHGPHWWLAPKEWARGSDGLPF